MVPRDIKKSFSNCYSEYNYNIDSLINIDGYYEMSYKSYYSNPTDSNTTNFIFFNDGLFYFDRIITEPGVPSHYVEFLSSNEVYKYNNNLRFNCWGNYIIKDDTIIAQFINNPSMLTATWSASEYKFKVINKTTIELILMKSIPNQDYYSPVPNKKRETSIAKFIPLDIIEEPNPWIKRKKWFWNEKEEWKKYRQNLKKDK